MHCSLITDPLRDLPVMASALFSTHIEKKAGPMKPVICAFSYRILKSFIIFLLKSY